MSRKRQFFTCSRRLWDYVASTFSGNPQPNTTSNSCLNVFTYTKYAISSVSLVPSFCCGRRLQNALRRCNSASRQILKVLHHFWVEEINMIWVDAFYRRCYGITVWDTYPLPRIEKCVESLENGTIFFVLHFNYRYWRTKVDPRERRNETTTNHHGVLHFTRMPLKLQITGTTF